MVHQHFHLVPTFTVAENIVLGGRGRVRHRSMDEQVAALGARYGLQVEPVGQGVATVGRRAAAGRDPQGARTRRARC